MGLAACAGAGQGAGVNEAMVVHDCIGMGEGAGVDKGTGWIWVQVWKRVQVWTQAEV